MTDSSKGATTDFDPQLHQKWGEYPPIWVSQSARPSNKVRVGGFDESWSVK